MRKLPGQRPVDGKIVGLAGVAVIVQRRAVNDMCHTGHERQEGSAGASKDGVVRRPEPFRIREASLTLNPGRVEPADDLTPD